MTTFRSDVICILFCIIVCSFLGGAVYDIRKDINSLQEHHIVDDANMYSYAYDCVMEAELAYWESKANLTREVQNYINTIAPNSNLRGYAIVDECEKYKVDICFVLAQGEIESHFATKGLGGKFNNVFNVAVHDKVKGKADMDKNYIYQYPNESIEPYLQLLTNRYLVNKMEYDLFDNYVDVNGSRYASDPDYESKLKSKYNYIIENTKIQEYLDVMHSYAIKCGR